MNYRTPNVRISEDVSSRTGLGRYLVVDGMTPSAEEVGWAADGATGVLIQGFDDATELSLSFLEPVIAVIPDLRVNTTAPVTGIEVVEGAISLRALSMSRRANGRPDLSRLPQLGYYEGPMTAPMVSVAANPHLREADIDGAYARSFTGFAGAIEYLSQDGARSQTALPLLAQPSALKSFERYGPARFDFAELEGCVGLERVNIVRCPELVNLAALTHLPHLQFLSLKVCASKESWEVLRDIPKAMIIDLKAPYPPRSWFEEAARNNWILDDWESLFSPTPTVPFQIDELEDAEGWGVMQYDASWLDEPLDGIGSDTLADGLTIERLMKHLVNALRSEGIHLTPTFDSESGMFAAYFEDHAQALKFAEHARALMADPDRIRELAKR